MNDPTFDSAAVIARVRTRVLDAIGEQTSVLHHTVRADAGEWEQLAPGIERKVLWERGGATSCLIRAVPGATFPRHGHAMDEETMMLEGSLQIGDVLLRAGDFHVGRSGVEHAPLSTADGCLCLLRTATSFFEPAG